jgi:hypothetical protein
MRTLVLQSCSNKQRESWIQNCVHSVADWAREKKYSYRFIDDELFTVVPDWYMRKVGSRLPIAADYARLVFLQKALEEGFEQVIWLDADVLVFDQALVFEFTGTCAFGHEVWIQERDGKLEARSNVHNAVCVFRQGCVILPFLLHTIIAMMKKVDPAHLAPQFVGPKLLSALHPLCDFALLPQVGAMSPLVVADICKGSISALNLMRFKSIISPLAVNLCASLISADEAVKVMAALNEEGRL